MSFRDLMLRGSVPGVGRVDPDALVDSPDDRPVRSEDDVLDHRFLSLLSNEGGTDWPTLLGEAEQLPQSGDLLRWLTEALHYQLIENDPVHGGRWRLTPAGEQRLIDLKRR